MEPNKKWELKDKTYGKHERIKEVLFQITERWGSVVEEIQKILNIANKMGSKRLSYPWKVHSKNLDP